MTLGALPAASSSLETMHATPEPTAPANLVTAIRPAIRADLDHYKTRRNGIFLFLIKSLSLRMSRGLLVPIDAVSSIQLAFDGKKVPFVVAPLVNDQIRNEEI